MNAIALFVIRDTESDKLFLPLILSETTLKLQEILKKEKKIDTAIHVFLKLYLRNSHKK